MWCFWKAWPPRHVIFVYDSESSRRQEVIVRSALFELQEKDKRQLKKIKRCLCQENP
jgi:hypothetical protein